MRPSPAATNRVSLGDLIFLTLHLSYEKTVFPLPRLLFYGGWLGTSRTGDARRVGFDGQQY